MKTIKIRLIVTMVTLAAAITIGTIPAEAQRRSSNERSRSERVSSSKSRKATTQKARKSTTVKSTRTKPKVNRPNNVKRQDIDRSPRKIERSDYRKSTQNRNTQAVKQPRNTTQRRSTQTTRQSGNTTERRNSQSATQTRSTSQRGNTETTRDRSQRIDNNRQANPRDINSGDRSRSTTRSDRMRENTSRNAKRILNNPDRRKDFDRNRPSRNYRGTDRTWSNSYRGDRYRNNRNYRNLNHWDHSWERYMWNNNSWRDYYRTYRAHSYLYHKHYYHHHRYGHVIRRFIHRPTVFIYNHVPYYCYDGYFFKYRRGIGYIMTDLAYNLIFPELPYGYETVYINGYVYFRVGNVFFEFVGDGYQVVYYPELFLAYRY